MSLRPGMAKGPSLSTGGSSGPPDLSAAVILLPTTSVRNVIQPSGAAVIPLTIKGFAAQSANLLQFQNSAGTSLAFVDSLGRITVSSAVVGAVMNGLTVENTDATAGAMATITVRRASGNTAGVAALVLAGAVNWNLVSTSLTAQGWFQLFSGASPASPANPILNITQSGDVTWRNGGTGIMTHLLTGNSTGEMVSQVENASTSSPIAGASIRVRLGNGSGASLGLQPNFQWIASGSWTWVAGPDPAVSHEWCLAADTTPGATFKRLRITTSGKSSIRAGLSTQFVFLGGGKSINVTAVGNVGTGEDTLMTSTLEANVLGSTGDSAYIECAGIYVLAATVQLRAYFGVDLLFDSGAFVTAAAGSWTLKIRIIRTGAATQLAICEYSDSAGGIAIASALTNPARTLSSSNDVIITGEATANNDVVQNLMLTDIRMAA